MTDHRVAHRSAALLLAYPDERLVEGLPLIRAALEEQSAGRGRAARREPYRHLLAFVDVVEQAPVQALARRYVEVFDLDRKHPLYLSYFTDGDTRRRGEVLAGFKQAYRDSGLLVDTHGELPDYLPMVLEFAATVDQFATSADRANSNDGFKKEKELGTYSGRLFFATTGDWAAAIQFRRDKDPRMPLERVDWIQGVRPASEPGT